MKKYLVSAFTIILLSACDPATSPNTRPETTSDNSIALANLRLGTAYLEQGEYEKSLSKLEKARAADPGYHATYTVLGLLHQRMGENDKAEEYFEKSLKLAPDNPSTLTNYGQFLCSTERYEEADSAFNSAANHPLYSTPEIANTNAGICAYKNQQPVQAEEYFRTALNQNPRVPAALLHMSQINLEQQNYLSARAYMQRFLEVARPTAKSLWINIQVEKALGDTDSVSSDVLLLKNNYPDSEETRMLRESGIQ